MTNSGLGINKATASEVTAATMRTYYVTMAGLCNIINNLLNIFHDNMSESVDSGLLGITTR
jgi:hypothetical protein